jgi:drug/metabolite transporter (DMT)-like permease
LAIAPVWIVTPIVASYPLVTGVVSALFLRDEKLSLQVVAGAGLTVAAVVLLVGASDEPRMISP